MRTGPVAPPKPDNAAVAVFFGAAPPQPYVEIGRIRVESRATLRDVLVQAQAEARALGADAIIIDLRYHYQSLPVTFDDTGTPHVPDTPRLNANAIAVVYVPPPAGP